MLDSTFNSLCEKYLQYCSENESAMEEHYECYITAHRNRVINPAVQRIEKIMIRLNISVDEFWSLYDAECDM